MKTLNALFACLLLLLLTAACDNAMPQEMKNEKKAVRWATCVTAPVEYPIEVDQGSWSTADDFICGFVNAGTEHMGWDEQGETLTGGSVVPERLSLTWIAFAEGKFWTIDTLIDKAKMGSLLEESYAYTDRLGVTKQVYYNTITVGLAPGGVVVVWLKGPGRRTEVGRYSAMPADININDFSDNSQNLTLSQFAESMYKSSVPDSIRAITAQSGIPYGIWDLYRHKYNYRFSVVFYKEDKHIYYHCVYLNGETEIVGGDKIDSFSLNALPWKADLKFTQKWAEVRFNDQEIMAAFEELTRENKEEPIEIVGKVGFMYQDMTFTVKSKKKAIPLKKIEVKFWNRAKP